MILHNVCHARRFLDVFVIFLLFLSTAEAENLSFDQAMEFLRTGCASGTSVSINTGTNGELLLSKKAPGGNISISISKESSFGSNNKDNRYKSEENDSIRECMKQYVPRLMDFYFKKTEYDWRSDAQRFTDIYSGVPGHIGSGMIEQVGNYKSSYGDSIFNDITIRKDKISLRTTEYRKGNLNRDILAEADVSDLRSYASHGTGGTVEWLELKCASGDCVKWKGWQFVSPSPNTVSRVQYNGEPTISYIGIPLANNMNDYLRIEMQKILSRIISSDHSDSIVCEKQRC